VRIGVLLSRSAVRPRSPTDLRFFFASRGLPSGSRWPAGQRGLFRTSSVGFQELAGGGDLDCNDVMLYVVGATAFRLISSFSLSLSERSRVPRIAPGSKTELSSTEDWIAAANW
jgi:hypothetical protein